MLRLYENWPRPVKPPRREHRGYENPIQRPPHPTVDQSASDVIATALFIAGANRPSAAETTARRTVNVKMIGEEQCGHLRPEREAVIALDRFGREERESRGDHHDDAAHDPRLHVAREARHRMCAKAEAQQPEIDDENRAPDDGQPHKMERFDDREQPQ